MQTNTTTKQVMEKGNINIVIDLLNEYDSVEHYINTTRKGLEKGKDSRSQDLLGIFDFIVGQAWKFCRNRQEVTDYVQSAFLQLMEVYDKFNPERGYQFSTFAGKWIRKGFQKMKRKTIMVPLSVHDMERCASFYILSSVFEMEHNRKPEFGELVTLIRTSGKKSIQDLSIQHIKYLLGFSSRTLSFDTPMGNDPDSPTLGDILVDPYTLPAYMYVA